MYHYHSKIYYMILSLALSMIAISANAEDEDKNNQPEINYVDMDRTFVIKLADKGKIPRYLKTEIQLVVNGKNSADRIRYHRAPIRHELVILLSSKTAEELQSVEAREALRLQSIEIINPQLEKLEKDLAVEEVLFTTFIVQ